MEYDENQKLEKDLRHHLGKAQCLALALCHPCSMPGRLGKVLGSKDRCAGMF